LRRSGRTGAKAPGDRARPAAHRALGPQEAYAPPASDPKGRRRLRPGCLAVRSDLVAQQRCTSCVHEVTDDRPRTVPPTRTIRHTRRPCLSRSIPHSIQPRAPEDPSLSITTGAILSDPPPSRLLAGSIGARPSSPKVNVTSAGNGCPATRARERRGTCRRTCSRSRCGAVTVGRRQVLTAQVLTAVAPHRTALAVVWPKRDEGDTYVMGQPPTGREPTGHFTNLRPNSRARSLVHRTFVLCAIAGRASS
jgi:hypothetical protein